MAARALETDAIRAAAFRSGCTGQVIVTGPCHDLCRLPGGLDADLVEWQAGFVDASGRFMDRREAALATGHVGRLEARAYFGGHAEPVLEAGHVESWRGSIAPRPSERCRGPSPVPEPGA